MKQLHHLRESVQKKASYEELYGHTKHPFVVIYSNDISYLISLDLSIIFRTLIRLTIIIPTSLNFQSLQMQMISAGKKKAKGIGR